MNIVKRAKEGFSSLTTESKIAYGFAYLFAAYAVVSVLLPGIVPPVDTGLPVAMAGLFGIGGGKSKSSNVQSNASAGYDIAENISQSGSQQGSTADSFGLNYSTSGQNIYGGQEPYLQALYANAANLLNPNALPDRQVAGINPMVASGLGNQFGFATGGGQDIYTAQLMSSLANMGGYGNAANTANVMSSGNVYNAPMTNGLNYATLAGSVNNPFLEGQIDAASRDVVRNLNENQLTGNAAMAAGTMNSGSSRRGVMDAIAMRGAADRVADIGATMRGNAYTTGLGLANATALANQQAALGTNSLNANLMSQGANLNYNLGQQGQTGLTQAYNTATANNQAQLDAGNYLRQYQQQLLDTAYSNQMNPYTGLQMYQSFIGAPTVLSNSNSIGLQNSTSNSFGNSFNNSYGYNQGGNMASGSGTGNSSSWNASLKT